MTNKERNLFSCFEVGSKLIIYFVVLIILDDRWILMQFYLNKNNLHHIFYISVWNLISFFFVSKKFLKKKKVDLQFIEYKFTFLIICNYFSSFLKRIMQFEWIHCFTEDQYFNKFTSGPFRECNWCKLEVHSITSSAKDHDAVVEPLYSCHLTEFFALYRNPISHLVIIKLQISDTFILRLLNVSGFSVLEF